MPSFKDSVGREWLVRLSGPRIEEVSKAVGINLVSLSDPVFPKFAEDMSLIPRCLWIICRKQALQANVDAEQFGEAVAGDCLEDAGKALTEAILDFFPQSTRDTLRALSRQDAATKTAAMDLLKTTLENPDFATAMQQNQMTQMKKLLASLTPRTGATVSQVSAELTPTNEP